MREREGKQVGIELDKRFRETPYADNLRSMPRWSRYMPEGVDRHAWRQILHADSDGLDQARLMLNLTDLFLRQDINNTAELTQKDKELLMKAMAAQNWGKSYNDEQNISADISYEFITTSDVEHRIRKFHTVYRELVPESDVKEEFIIEHAIYDRTSKLGKVFDAIRRLNCLRTGLIAYRGFKEHPDDKNYEQLGALSLGVFANQLIPLISYAEDYEPVKSALMGASLDIETIFTDSGLRHSPFISTQQTTDSIERARMIWERSYDNPNMPIHTGNRKDTIFSTGSAFEKRFVNNKAELTTIIEGLRNLGMHIVLTSGSFDLLHVGHAAYLEKASDFGDILVVGVDSDAKIKQRKGEGRPIVSEEERVRLLSHLRGVGLITLKYPDEERWGLIKLVHPDVLVVTAETYQPDEIRQLERGYCGRVVVLEPQATTSTGAQIRKIEIGATKRSDEEVSQLLGERVLTTLQSGLTESEKLTEIKHILQTP